MVIASLDVGRSLANEGKVRGNKTWVPFIRECREQLVNIVAVVVVDGERNSVPAKGILCFLWLSET